jgi:hypothetical protein
LPLFAVDHAGLRDPTPQQIRVQFMTQRDRRNRHPRPRTFGDDMGLEILAVTPPPAPSVSQTLVRSVHVST